MLRRGFVSERTRATRRVAQLRTEDARSFLLSDSGSGEDGGMLDHARSLALEQARGDESGGSQEAAAMAVCAGWVRKALSGYPQSLEQDEALLRNGTVEDGRVRSLVELRLDEKRVLRWWQQQLEGYKPDHKELR